MTAWVLRQLQHPTGPEQFVEALGVVERMGTALEFLAKCDSCTADNQHLRAAIRVALTEYREGPQ